MVYLKTESGRVIETDYPEHWPSAERMTRKAGSAAYRAQACEELRAILSPRDEVACVLRHVSRSGMMRHISLFIARDGALHNITQRAADAMGDTVARDGGIKMGGCGMDMGFALVYALGATLWPNGTREPHGTRNGEPDSDGGYALRHRWI